MVSARSILRRIRLPNDHLRVNEDVRPADAARRTWNFWTFHNSWLLTNCSLSTFLTGSALIPLGLNWKEAIVCIVVGNALSTAAILLNSMVGSFYHISFPIFSRAVWGVWGAHFAIWNRIFLSIVWYGFQTWVGGQCFYLILLSWDPNIEQHIHNTMPADTGMTTAEFVAYIIFYLISLPFILIRPHRLHTLFWCSSTTAFIFFLSVLIWALATMGPAGFGDTLAKDPDAPAQQTQGKGWLMVYGIMSTIGAIAAGILNQSDFTRFAKRPRSAIMGQGIAFPIYAVYTSVLGILVVAATQKRMDGEALWNLPKLFVRLLGKDNSAGTRAALFFAGAALVTSQIGSNVPGNAIAGGIDLASTVPRYINIRRGAFITAIVSPAVNPWRLVNTATIFISVLSSYGVFLAPMTGMMSAHYFLVCRRKINIDDLYTMSSGSIYWYTFGVNWRAPISWLIGCVPCLPGFIAAVDGTVTVSPGATRLYLMNYMYGFLSSGMVYTILHWVFPAPRMDAFVRTAASPHELQVENRQRLEHISLENGSSKSDTGGFTEPTDVAHVGDAGTQFRVGFV